MGLCKIIIQYKTGQRAITYTQTKGVKCRSGQALEQGRFSWRHDCILAFTILFQILEKDLRSIESRSLDCTSRPSKCEVNSTSRETFRLENSCFFRDLAGICCKVSKADLTLVTTDWIRLGIASFPGSCAEEEEREPGAHCSRMRQVPLVTWILLRYAVGHIRMILKSKTISL